MSLESPENVKNFPGLYRQECVNEIIAEDDSAARRRDSRRDTKRDKKEMGYSVFEEENSGEEEASIVGDARSPFKAIKRTKSTFKFSVKKDIFPRLKEKVEGHEKESRKERKGRMLEEKAGRKSKVKRKSKCREQIVVSPIETCEKPIFGVPLEIAVERSRSHDGIQLPACVRECIDYVEECGLTCEGIYRISGVKSKVQQLKDAYNRGLPVNLAEHDPNTVASLLKIFLRELPESVLTSALVPRFEQASSTEGSGQVETVMQVVGREVNEHGCGANVLVTGLLPEIKGSDRKVEAFVRLVDELPVCNRLLLSWITVHATHIIGLQDQNRMSMKNMSIVLSPNMQISLQVLNALILHAHRIFNDTYLKKYVPPLRAATSLWSLELPDCTGALEEELAKQESLLNQLHDQITAGQLQPTVEEQLWEVQRVVTQLKRKIKMSKKSKHTSARHNIELDEKRSSQISEAEDLHLELRQAPQTWPSAGRSDANDLHLELHQAPQTLPSAGRSDDQSVGAVSTGCTERSSNGTDGKSGHSIGDKHTTGVLITAGEDVGGGGECSPTAVHETDGGEEVVSLTICQAEVEIGESDVKFSGENDVSFQMGVVAGERRPQSVSDEAGLDQSVVAPDIDPASRDRGSSTAGALDKFPGQNIAVEIGDDGETRLADEERCSMVAVKGSCEGVSDESGLPPPIISVPQTAMTTNTDDLDSLSATGPHGDEIGEVRTMSGGGGQGEVTIGAVPVNLSPYHSLEPLLPIVTCRSRSMPTYSAVDDPEGSGYCLLGDRSVNFNEVNHLGDEGSTCRTRANQPMTDDIVNGGSEELVTETRSVIDAELQALVEVEFLMGLEEEELVTIGDELRKKIETEHGEIERLQQEIQELQYLRHDSDVDDFSSASDSSLDSDDGEDVLSSLIDANLKLERENAEMYQKIHEERMICLSVKLHIRLLQQRVASQNSHPGDL